MSVPYQIAFTFHAMAASGNISDLKMQLKKAEAEQAASIINSRDHRGFTVLHKSMESGKIELIQMLIDLGADINAEVTGLDPKGWTSMHLAAFDNHPEIIGLLANHGAELGHRGKGITKMTPLRVAVTRDHPECVSKLLELGADPLEKDPQGYTLLHEAANIGNSDIIKQLLAAGCKPFEKAKDGSTPTMWAAQHCDGTLIDLLEK